ncbi:MAG TPA: hypothetical protein VNF47_07685 [Streptosporangiaceae bacterium]|nr:hypothetical protein [Streptosporangiaceae bacterium]
MRQLARRKLGGLLARARRGPLAADLTRFTAAATDLDYSGHIVRRSAERVVLRLLIQTGRPLRELTAGDLSDLAAACQRSGEAKGSQTGWRNDRELTSPRTRCCSTSGSSAPRRSIPAAVTAWTATAPRSPSRCGRCSSITAPSRPPPERLPR